MTSQWEHTVFVLPSGEISQYDLEVRTGSDKTPEELGWQLGPFTTSQLKAKQRWLELHYPGSTLLRAWFDMVPPDHGPE